DRDPDRAVPALRVRFLVRDFSPFSRDTQSRGGFPVSIPVSASRRLLPLFALFLLVAVPSQAQKRRSVRVPPPASGPIGQCHTFGLVRAGLVASYLTTGAPGGNVSFIITYISDTPTQTKTTQKVTTPQGN